MSDLMDAASLCLRHTHGTALSWTGGVLSYEQLRDRVCLRAGGFAKWVHSGDRVCVMHESRLDHVISSLAVWWLGATLVPIDSSYPKARIAYILEDSQAAAIVTDDGATEDLALSGARLVTLEMLREQSAAAAQSVAIDQLAYIIYTSGSTGRPKGVAVSHRGLTNLAEAQAAMFEVGTTSRVLLFASPSFDASVSEIIVTLAAGATLVIPGAQERSSLRELQDFVCAQRVSIATLPPSILALLDPARLGTLKTLVTAGEPCTRRIVELYADRLKLINAYGPTEATVCATMGRLLAENETVTIGREMQGVEILLLDEERQKVPNGNVGEIAISGVGLAEGYWNDAERTRQAFARHPYAQERTIYLTGDLARRLPDGELVLVGRKDEQIKISGFRVEPAEVEAGLAGYPDVIDAIAIPISEDDRTELLGCVLTNVSTNESHLRDYLSSRLPHYMVPTRFVFCGRWPTTPNGKIDRKELVARAKRERDERHENASAKFGVDADMQTVLGLWSRAVGNPPAELSVEFYASGGTSLKLLELIEKLETSLSVELNLRSLHQGPITPQRLLESVRHNAGPPSPYVCFGDKPPSIFLVPPVAGDPLFYSRFVSLLLTEQTVAAFYAPELCGRETPDTLTGLASYYADCVEELAPRGPIGMAGYSLGAMLSMATAYELIARGRELKELLMIEGTVLPGKPAATELERFGGADCGIVFASTVIARTLEKPAPITPEQIRSVNEDAALELFYHALQDLGVFRSTSTREQAVAVYRAMMRAHKVAVESLLSPYPGDVLHILAREDRRPGLCRDFGSVVKGTLREREVSGDHFTCMTGTRVNELAEVVRESWTALKS